MSAVLMLTSEAADYLGLSYSGIRWLTDHGRIPVVGVIGRRRIRVYALADLEHYRAERGEPHRHTRLTTAQAIAIYQRVQAGEPRAVIAADYGFSVSVVNHIAIGRSWSAVTGHRHEPSSHIGGPLGAANGQHRLTQDDVLCIYRRVKAGERFADLGREYGVTESAIRQIGVGATWGWLTQPVMVSP